MASAEDEQPSDDDDDDERDDVQFEDTTPQSFVNHNVVRPFFN